MKTLKIIFSFSIFLLINMNLSSQIKVTSAGDLRIYGDEDLNFGSSTNGDWILEHWDDGLHFGKPSGSTNAGLYKLFINDDNGYIGVGMKPEGLLQMCKPQSANYIGLLIGYGGNDIQGRYGTAQGRLSAYNGDLILNRWAGNVGIGTTSPSCKLHVDGDIYTTGSYQGSDIRLKDSITNLENCYEKLSQLNGINYIFKKEEILADSTGETPIETVTSTRKQNGFSAQQVQQVLPELVTEDNEGYLAIDYISFIPMLVEALKDQNEKIELLEAELENSETLELQAKSISGDESSTAVFDSEIQPYLGNNVPNPFDQNTEIEFYLPQEISNADFYIYDLQGKQIRKMNVVEREYGSIVIEGSILVPGMYYYSLIADNQVIGTKQMILTD